MKLSELHLLLTYRCNFQCDHCFVWGGPWQTGTMTLAMVRDILRQGRELGGVETIYFEGGEPFLYHPTLVAAVRLAKAAGFEVGIVSNAYWGTSVEDAREWLRPFVGLVSDLSLSSDAYHWSDELGGLVENAHAAAGELGIPVGIISIAQPDSGDAAASSGRLRREESAVMYRGRAAEALTSKIRRRPAAELTECPHEDLREPGRVHVDPFGNVHICQGITIGNLFETPLDEIRDDYAPLHHPITGPLVDGGPAELFRRHGLDPEEKYADACHMCQGGRMALRDRFPEILRPNQMYGLPE